jgi:hypothetical protein
VPIHLGDVIFKRLPREDSWEIAVRGTTAQFTILRNKQGDAESYSYTLVAFTDDITLSELSDVIHRAILAGIIE